MPDVVVHVAGHPVTYDGTLRQRCLWCGAAIIDTHLDLDLRHPGAVWAPGNFVAVDPDGHRYAIMPPSDGEDPAGFCAAIDPAVTG